MACLFYVSFQAKQLMHSNLLNSPKIPQEESIVPVFRWEDEKSGNVYSQEVYALPAPMAAIHKD